MSLLNDAGKDAGSTAVQELGTEVPAWISQLQSVALTILERLDGATLNIGGLQVTLNLKPK
jgi:hypothetical protein